MPVTCNSEESINTEQDQNAARDQIGIAVRNTGSEAPAKGIPEIQKESRYHKRNRGGGEKCHAGDAGADSDP